MRQQRWSPIGGHFCYSTTISRQRPNQGIPGAHFDMERCGARMTFDYFAPRLEHRRSRKIRWIVDHVEDRDLGLMRLPRTGDNLCVLDSLDHHPNDWMMAGIGGIDHATNSGRSIVRFKRRQIEQIADRAGSLASMEARS